MSSLSLAFANAVNAGRAGFLAARHALGSVAAGAPILREGETSASSSIHINFDPTQMFTYSNVIIDCMMPVVYITAGLSLGFTVIYALKSAFSSRF